ncbi:MAG: hypothetical protein ACRYFU_26145 [Janthinobacterium lividum]
MPEFHMVRDAGTVAIACLPYMYLARFKAKTQIISQRVIDEKTGIWKMTQKPTLLHRIYEQYFSLVHTHGLVLFLGSGWPHAYRLAIGLLLGGSFLLAIWAIWVKPCAVDGKLLEVWLLYAGLLAIALILVPDEFAGGYFFVKRMQILLYICVVVAASEPLRRLPAMAAGIAGFSIAVSLLTLLLGIRYITPVAHTILSLRDLPSAPANARPGFLMRPVGVAFPAHLNFDSYNWAPVDYLRWHGLLLFNTSWLGEPLVPIGPRPEALSLLDESYFNQAPQFGDRLMADEPIARHLFDKIGFVLVQRVCVKQIQNPFSEKAGSSRAGDFSRNWKCSSPDDNWSLCQASHK